jgi:hypothetical protein
MRRKQITSTGSNGITAKEKFKKARQKECLENSSNENHKKSHDFRLMETQTQHKEPENKHLKFLTPPTPSAGKIADFLGFKRFLFCCALCNFIRPSTSSSTSTSRKSPSPPSTAFGSPIWSVVTRIGDCLRTPLS